tara:strand:+ start:85 stop:462 length:378 start_codon:yes stop_codon:yes gene_type:complete
MKRIILELGTGNDLYGEDYTKAACRAVQDAIHHSSLIIMGTLNLDFKKMNVKVHIGVQSPESLDVDIIKKELPHGNIEVVPTLGGLNLVDEQKSIENTGYGNVSVIATAAIEVFYDLNPENYNLC